MTSNKEYDFYDPPVFLIYLAIITMTNLHNFQLQIKCLKVLIVKPDSYLIVNADQSISNVTFDTAISWKISNCNQRLNYVMILSTHGTHQSKKEMTNLHFILKDCC